MLAIYETDWWKAYGPFDRAVASKRQKALMDALKVFRYGASLEADGAKYVPSGLADDDGNGPSHQNYVIIVRW